MTEQQTWTPQRIKSLRQFLNMTQHDLAVTLGTSQQRVSFWENGHNKPSGGFRKLLDFVAERNKVPIDKLLHL
jgi:DNA-binding transcriptional regulator YiaG